MRVKLKMNEQLIKQTTFKLNFFETFPVDEFNKIDAAMKKLGYKGTIVPNGNIVYELEPFNLID